MSERTELIDLEEGFWRSAGNRDSYAANLADDALHVFPGWGLTAENERILEAVESVDPWEAFRIDDLRVVDLGDEAAALVYTAHAHRAGQDEYVAAMTSVYRHDADGWKLVIHQQTPLSIGRER
jgi:ketosteroid isomerase-like protein